jgi:hypothetical protein
MCDPEKNKELMRVFGLCPWPNKFINTMPHLRHKRFTEADAFLRFIADQDDFDFDWELYLVFETEKQKAGVQSVQPIAVVYATCVGRVYNRVSNA